MAAVMKYKIASIDFIQAYLQYLYRLSRKIYVKPKLEGLELLEIDPDTLLELLKPLYGICDSGDYWSATFNRFIKEYLKLTLLSGYPALHIKSDESVTTGILGAYVDDSMFVFGPEFESIIDCIKLKFDSKSLEWENVDFIGI